MIAGVIDYQSYLLHSTNRVCIAGVCLYVNDVPVKLRIYSKRELQELISNSPTWDYRKQIYEEALSKFLEEN